MPWPFPVPSRAPPRSFTSTDAPSRASASACSRPIPPPAPVTIATFPSSKPMSSSSVGSSKQDRPHAAERLEAEALVEALRGVVAVDDRELHVVGARRERLFAERRGARGREAAAALVRPRVDALQEPALAALHVGIADERDLARALDHARARDPAAHPAPESAHVARERIGAVLLAQALARREDERLEVALRGGARRAIGGTG